MKKILKTLWITALTLQCLTVSAFAHDFWLTAQPLEKSYKMNITMGFGHNMIEEDIPERILPIISLPVLYTAGGEITFSSTDKSTLYISDTMVPQGTHLAASVWQQIMWVKKPGIEEPVLGSKKEHPDAERSMQLSRFAKMIVNVGKPSGFSTKPLGHALEIVAMADPATLGTTKPLPVKLLFQGKPKADGELEVFCLRTDGSIADPVTIKTDKKGEALIPVDQAGTWFVFTAYDQPHKDPAVCDMEHYDTSLSFTISDKKR